MECEFNRTPYKRRLDNYSGHKHLTASMQPSKYSEHTFKIEFGRTRKHLQNYLEACSISTTKSSEACQTRAYGTVHMAYILEIRVGTWPTPYTSYNYS
jgi:hypothetical protein